MSSFKTTTIVIRNEGGEGGGERKGQGSVTLKSFQRLPYH